MAVARGALRRALQRPVPSAGGSLAVHSSFGAGTRPAPWRVLVLVRHPLLRRALATLVAGEPGWAVCGDSGTGPDTPAIDDPGAIARWRPDLLIAELPFDPISGLAQLRHTCARHPGLALLLVCWHDQMGWADAARQAGARACIARHEIGTRLPGLLRQGLLRPYPQSGIGDSPMPDTGLFRARDSEAAPDGKPGAST